MNDVAQRLRDLDCGYAMRQHLNAAIDEMQRLMDEIDRLQADVALYRRWVSGEMTIRIAQADWIEMGATELTDPTVRVIWLRDLYRAASDLRGREEPDDGDPGDED